MIGITPDAANFTKITGEPAEFTLSESAAGRFSGLEKMFWTEENDCVTVTTDASRFGTIPAGDGSVTTTTITLAAVQPKVYKMCYDDAYSGAGYKIYSNVLLTVQGKSRLLHLRCWIMFL